MHQPREEREPSLDIYEDDGHKGSDDDDDFSPVDPPIETVPPSLDGTDSPKSSRKNRPGNSPHRNSSSPLKGAHHHNQTSEPINGYKPTSTPGGTNSTLPKKDPQPPINDESARELTQWRQRAKLCKALQRDWERARRGTYHRLRVDSFDNGTSNSKEKYDFALQRRGTLASDRDSLGDRYLPVAFRQKLERHLIGAEKRAGEQVHYAMFAHQDPTFKKELLKRRMGHKSRMTLHDANARTASAVPRSATTNAATYVEDKYAPIPPPPSTCFHPSESSSPSAYANAATAKTAPPFKDIVVSENAVQEDGCVNVASLFIRGGALPDDGREMRYLHSPFSVATLFLPGTALSGEGGNTPSADSLPPTTADDGGPEPHASATASTKKKGPAKKKDTLMSSLPIERPQSVDHVLQLKALFLHWAGGGLGGSANSGGLEPVIPLNGPYAPDIPALVNEGVAISNIHRRKNGASGGGGVEGDRASAAAASNVALGSTTNMTADLFTVAGCASSRDGGLGTEKWANIVFDWLDLLGCFRRSSSSHDGSIEGKFCGADDFVGGPSPTAAPDPAELGINQAPSTAGKKKSGGSAASLYDTSGATTFTMNLSDWLLITCCDLMKDWEVVAGLRNAYEGITTVGEIYHTRLEEEAVRARPRTVAGLVRAMERARCKLQNEMKLNCIANNSTLARERRRQMAVARRAMNNGTAAAALMSPRTATSTATTPRGKWGKFVPIQCPPPPQPLHANRPTSAQRKKLASHTQQQHQEEVESLVLALVAPGEVVAASASPSLPTSTAHARPMSASSRASSASRKRPPMSDVAPADKKAKPVKIPQPPPSVPSSSSRPSSAAIARNPPRPSSSSAQRARSESQASSAATVVEEDEDEATLNKRLHRTFLRERAKAEANTLTHVVRDVWKLLACGICVTDHDYEALILAAFDAQVDAECNAASRRRRNNSELAKKVDDDNNNNEESDEDALDATALFVHGVDSGVVVPPLDFSACLLLLLSHRAKMYLAKGTVRVFPSVLPPMEVLEELSPARTGRSTTTSPVRNPPKADDQVPPPGMSVTPPPAAMRVVASEGKEQGSGDKQHPEGINLYLNDDFESSSEDNDESANGKPGMKTQVHHPAPPSSTDPQQQGVRSGRRRSSVSDAVITKLRHYHNPIPALRMPMPRSATPAERSAAVRFYSSVTPGGRKAVLYTMRLMQERAKEAQQLDPSDASSDEDDKATAGDPHRGEEGYIKQKLKNGEVRWTRKIIERPIPIAMTEASKRVRASTATHRGGATAGVATVSGDVANAKRAMLDFETRTLRYTRGVWK